ncbi:hypothetical protein BZZ01_14400 [Nostocales cyanobacterium HT-58-2]|nr:hypothetical protein BZZ01_14400 [Nostocales cyanobacterium HT-58-2]
MASNLLQHAVGIFPSRRSVLQALNELSSSGFAMEKVSIITQKTKIDEQSDSMSEPALTPPEGAVAGAMAGATTGGSLALVGGLAALLIPGIGLAVAAESILLILLGTGASAAAGGLVGALRGWFVPKEAAQLYNERVFQGHYLMMLEGTKKDICHAEVILTRCGIQQWRVFDIPLN